MRCSVCKLQSSNGDVKIRNGVNSCSACGSFFRNNANSNNKAKTSFICKTGQMNCFDDGKIIKESAIICGNGRIWRFACAYCRFEKCLQVGMRVGKYNKSKAIVAPMVQLDVGNEQYDGSIHNLVLTFEKYRRSLHSMPGVTITCSDTKELVEMMKSNMMEVSKTFSSLLKDINGFKLVPMKERTIIFAFGMVRSTLLAMVTNGNDTGTLLSKDNYNLICQAFPDIHYKEFKDVMSKAKYLLVNSQLDPFEISILFALLSFNIPS